MSATSKLLVVLGIGGGLVAVVCCGVLGVFIWGGYQMSQSVSTDPAVVRQTTGEITQIEIRSDFEPQAAINLRIPVVDKLILRSAVYSHPEGHGWLVLAQIDPEIGGHDPERMHDSLKNFSEFRDAEHHEEIEFGPPEEREFTVRGQPAKFLIARGKGAQSGKEYVRALGAFPGKSGSALLAFFIEADKFHEDELKQMLDSIK